MAKKKLPVNNPELRNLSVSIALLSVIPCILLAARIILSQSSRYNFLFWNLFLAIIPLILAWWLVNRIKQYGWANWRQALLTFAWIVFLPNSFYIVTDLIHLRPNYEADLLFDAIMMAGFIFAGLYFGIASIFLVHLEMLKRVSKRAAYGWSGLIILAVSFAVCLGRYTRWNTWDIIVRPAGLLFDVSDRLIDPGSHIQTYQTTLVLFLVLFSLYIAIWETAEFLRR